MTRIDEVYVKIVVYGLIVAIIGGFVWLYTHPTPPRWWLAHTDCLFVHEGDDAWFHVDYANVSEIVSQSGDRGCSIVLKRR